MRRGLMTAQADFIGDCLLEARHSDATDQSRVAQTTLFRKEGMGRRQWTLAINGLLPAARASKPKYGSHGNRQSQKQTPEAEGGEVLEVIQVMARAQRFGGSLSHGFFVQL